MKWLFLRGEWDERTQKSIDDNDDMWIHLFNKLGSGQLWFKDMPISETPTHIFARGGFDYYIPILKRFPNAYKIRYGAGRRFMPETDVKYDLVFVDTKEQRSAVRKAFPGVTCELLVKPAAEHFKYMPNVEKEYDVCFIANGQQAAFKGIGYVYDTFRDLKVLHLGYPIARKPPKNITSLRVDRKDIPVWINKCKVGIVPYFNKVDSCPRVVPEMIACGLPIVVSNELCIDDKLYPNFRADKVNFVDVVKKTLTKKFEHDMISGYYRKNISVEVASQKILSIIEEASCTK